MILVWNDAKSFKRHVEAMRIFRHSHNIDAADRLLLRDMPVPYENDSSLAESPVNYFTDSKGRLIFVPIWIISMPQGAQN
jgi:hypothetical protein